MPAPAGSPPPAGDEAAPLLQLRGWPRVPDFAVQLGQAWVWCEPQAARRAELLDVLALAQPPAQGRLWVDGSPAWWPGPPDAAQRATWQRRVAALAADPAAALVQLQARTPAAGPALFVGDLSHWIDSPAATAVVQVCRALQAQHVGFVFLVAREAPALAGWTQPLHG